MSNTKKAKANLMSEEAFREAVMPMLEQAYKQGYEDGMADKAVFEKNLDTPAEDVLKLLDESREERSE